MDFETWRILATHTSSQFPHWDDYSTRLRAIGATFKKVLVAVDRVLTQKCAWQFTTIVRSISSSGHSRR